MLRRNIFHELIWEHDNRIVSYEKVGAEIMAQHDFDFVMDYLEVCAG